MDVGPRYIRIARVYNYGNGDHDHRTLHCFVDRTNGEVLRGSWKQPRHTQKSRGNTRLIVLHEINVAIAKLRSSLDLPLIDDPLPGQPDNAYRLIRKLFTSFPPRAGERAAASGKSETVTVETSNE
jgi:hypothetical protein